MFINCEFRSEGLVGFVQILVEKLLTLDISGHCFIPCMFVLLEMAGVLICLNFGY